MFADCNGTQNVLKYISNSGHSKFHITKYGTSKSSIPLYYCVHTNTNKAAAEAFYNWAQTCGQGNNPNLYCLTLFSDTDENNGLKAGKAGKCEIIFSLNETPGEFKTPGASFDYSEAYNKGKQEAEQEAEKRTLLQEMQALRLELQQIKNELEEEQEEEEQESASISGPEQMAQYIAMLQGLLKPNNPPQLNGTETTAPPTPPKKTLFNAEQSANINTALRLLYKNNPQIDTDLLKLANISENQPATFKILLNSLRNM